MTGGDRLLPWEEQSDAEEEIQPQQDAYERAQMRTLDLDASWRETHIKRENQRIDLRKSAYEHAVAVCLGMALYLGVMALIIGLGNGEEFAPQAQVAIFATPVVAIAAITIFVLRGVFSGFSEKSISEDAQMISQFTNSVNGN